MRSTPSGPGTRQDSQTPVQLGLIFLWLISPIYLYVNFNGPFWKRAKIKSKSYCSLCPLYLYLWLLSVSWHCPLHCCCNPRPPHASRRSPTGLSKQTKCKSKQGGDGAWLPVWLWLSTWNSSKVQLISFSLPSPLRTSILQVHFKLRVSLLYPSCMTYLTLPPPPPDRSRSPPLLTPMWSAYCTSYVGHPPSLAAFPKKPPFSLPSPSSQRALRSFLIRSTGFPIFI